MTDAHDQHGPTHEDLGDLDSETFRTEAHTLVDWIADYLGGGVAELPVLAKTVPGTLQNALPVEPPHDGEPLERIRRDFTAQVLPAVTHWNHPGFLAYFGISGSAPGVLGEMLSAALNVNGMLWRTCPALTELEMVVMDWLRQMVGLPAPRFGLLTDTASVSSLVALAAARDHADPDSRQLGAAGQRSAGALTVYHSDQAHSSIPKACITLGLGLEAVRAIPHDAQYRMQPAALRAAIERDRSNGFRPMAVVATVGTTSTTSVDPVCEIAAICAEHDIWLHVDAAYAGSAAVSLAHRWCLDGCERADSLVLNPHKWLFTQIDCSALYTRHPEILRRAFSLVPEYLTTPVQGQVVDLMDYGVQLGRRFRALKLWWVIRSFGVEGLRRRIDHQIEMAQRFAEWVDRSSRFERLAETPFSVICFRAHPDQIPDGEQLDELNLTLMERVNASGEIYLSHTRLDPGISLRVAIGNLRTSPEHVRRCQDLLDHAYDELAAKL
jgi:aromatic-L-amino-acid decarboxylase